MARVTMRAIVPHSTHDAHGEQHHHDVGASYDIDDTDVDNVTALGFAVRVPTADAVADAPPPATPAPKRRK